MTTPGQFIASRRWQVATTMPDWPHEYTVKAWVADDLDSFTSFCQKIKGEGDVEPWPPPPEVAIYHNHYLVIGEHKYWAMGPLGDLDEPEDVTVINRAGARAVAASG